METFDPSLIDQVRAAWGVIMTSLPVRIGVFLLMIYALVLIVDIVLLLSSRDLRADLHGTLIGTNLPTPASVRRRWRIIEKHAATSDDAMVLAAVLEADHLVMDLLSRAGYGGSFSEQITAIEHHSIPHVDLLRQAHECAERIVTRQVHSLSKDDAVTVLTHYKTFLSGIEFL